MVLLRHLSSSEVCHISGDRNDLADSHGHALTAAGHSDGHSYLAITPLLTTRGATRRAIHSSFLTLEGDEEPKHIDEDAPDAKVEPKCGHKLAKCPQYWEDVGEDLCLAPKWYKHLNQRTKTWCELLKSFRGWTDKMKEEYREECWVTWVCKKAKKPDLEEEECDELDLSECPRGWSLKENGRCAPPTDVRIEGNCSDGNFAKKTDEEKLAWASDCGINWPCMGEEKVLPETRPRAPGIFAKIPGSPGPIDYHQGIAICSEPGKCAKPRRIPQPEELENPPPDEDAPKPPTEPINKPIDEIDLDQDTAAAKEYVLKE